VYEKRLLTVDQVRVILAALDEECRFLVQLLLGTGLNISEALGLKWGDIDFETGTFTPRRRWWRGDLSEDSVLKTDNREARLVLGGLLASELRTRKKKPEEFIFTLDGKVPYDDRDLLSERFRPVVKRLGLYYKGFGWHAFRRQNITWRQTIGGATPLEAQKGARHGSLDMTLLYTQRDHERERAQVDAIFDKLMEGATVPSPLLR
jgi:integrase